VGLDAWSRAWVLVIAGLSVGVIAAVFLDLPAPIRPVIVIGFVVLAPGMALARLLGLPSRLAETALGIGLGLSIAGLLGGVFLYLSSWSPTRILAVLLVISIGGLALDPVLIPRHAWRDLGRAVRTRGRLLIGGASAPLEQGAREASMDSPPATMPTDVVALEPQRAGVDSPHEHRPPPPVAVVRRRFTKPTAVPAQRRKAKGGIGIDPLADDALSANLRATIDQVIDDLTERKDAPPS
jgi:hypothetical protein